MVELNVRADAYLQPISADEPAGQSANVDPRYEALRNEVGKLDSPSGGDVDWARVAADARDLLTNTTKDFLLGSYNAIALLETEGWAGLTLGLMIQRGLFDRYWDHGFPPLARLRARVNAFDWLTARLDFLLSNLTVDAGQAAGFIAAQEAWNDLATLARARLDAQCPATSGVTGNFARLGLRVPEQAPEHSVATGPTPSPPPDVSEAPSNLSVPPAAPAPTPPPTATASDAPPQDDLAPYTSKAQHWLAPCPGPTPAGADPRYDPAYGTARAEIAKLEAISGGSVDWKTVEEQASAILTQQGKDLLVAGYLACAKLHRGGLDDLIVGLVVCHDLVEQFWDGLHPDRVRGRSNALAWLFGHLETALAQVELSPSDRPKVVALEAVVTRFLKLTRDRFGADAPSSGGLGDRVKRMVLAVPEPKAAPARAVTSPVPAPPQPTAATPPSAPGPNAAPKANLPSLGGVQSLDDVVGFLQEAGRGLVRAASEVRRASSATPSAYRLLRVGLYLHISAPPPSDAGGKTQIPGLPANRRQQLALMDANGKWEALLEECESSLQQFRFCLDLHRYSHRALEHLGETFAPAREELVAETRTLLGRLPTLLDLRAADGSPLADPETKTWIQQVVLATSGTSAASPQPSDTQDGAALTEIRGLLTGGKPADAMRSAQAYIDRAPYGRQRFSRRVELAHLCLDHQQVAMARGMFGALEQELTNRNLTEWEPELTARCLEGYVRALRAAAKMGARVENPERVFERLCLVDPLAAARLATTS